jgi:hypothetical protein
MPEYKSILLKEELTVLIHKVTRPAFLSLVAQPKQSENDPGGSTGSGNFYENQGGPQSETPPDPEAPSPDHFEAEEKKAKLAIVVATEQIGMTAIVAEFLEQKREDIPVSPGLSIRYVADAQPAKGLLLNKKAE